MSFLLASPVYAEGFPSDSLTPYGAIKQGNAEGTIGPWLGDTNDIKSFGPELLQEEPLFSIDKSNLEDFKEQLPFGLYQLVKHYPETMKIPVFKSYRSGYYPDWVYEAVAKNYSSVSTEDDGITLLNTYPGIPFPVPKNGAQVIWNHLLAFKGVSFEVEFLEATVQPDGRVNTTSNLLKISLEYYNKNREISGLKQPYVYYYSTVTSPPRLSGSALIIHEKVNAFRFPRQAWGYFAAERKVLRLPGVDYDSPMMGSESIRFADEIDIYNGSIDRYDWKLIGKQEKIIPYNNQRLFDYLSSGENIDDFLQPLHVSPKYLRYEKHRVWVVEGRLKEGKSHPYKRRLFYIDEDSWLIVAAENYDRNNQLWRVSLSYPKQYHELPGVFKTADTFHDLKDQTYYIQTLRPGTSGRIATRDEVLPKREFKPNVLRRLAR